MKIFDNFLKSVQEIMFFVKTRENLPDTSLTLLKYILKSFLFRNSLKNNFSNFEIFSEFPIHCVYRQNSQNINPWLVKFI